MQLWTFALRMPVLGEELGHEIGVAPGAEEGEGSLAGVFRHCSRRLRGGDHRRAEVNLVFTVDLFN